MAYEFVSIYPQFTVTDWEAARPIMDEFTEKTKTEAGCVYYGWQKTGNKLQCREAYVDGDAVNAHLANVGPCIGKLLDGPATLDHIAIGGPAAEIEKTKEGTAALGTVYFETYGGFSQNMEFPAAAQGENSFLTIDPVFSVADWDAAKPIMDEFIEKTKAEAGCVFYGWVKTGDKLRCREAYVDGDAVNAHLANVGECIGKLLDGPASLDSIAIGGPAAELEKTKEGTAALGTVYYEFDSGFKQF